MDKRSRDKKPQILLGFIAGVVGGLAGTAAMIVAEQIYASRAAGDTLPLEESGKSVALRSRNRRGGGAAKKLVHWAFGTVAGGVYGVVAEVSPRVTEGKGAVLGVMMNFAAHDSTMQAIGLAPPPSRYVQADGRELSRYAMYGMAAEFVRRHARWLLERRDLKRMRQAERHAASHVNLK